MTTGSPQAYWRRAGMLIVVGTNLAVGLTSTRTSVRIWYAVGPSEHRCRRRRAAWIGTHRLRPQCPDAAVRGHHVSRSPLQIGAEPNSARRGVAIPIHRQRIPRLLARLPILLRPADP